MDTEDIEQSETEEGGLSTIQEAEETSEYWWRGGGGEHIAICKYKG